MVAISKAEITAKVYAEWPMYEGTFPGDPRRRMLKWVRLTLSTGTNNQYATGGLPLDNVFTAGNASDCGLDINEAIIQVGAAYLRRSATDYTRVMPVQLVNAVSGGSAPAVTDLNLIVYETVVDDTADVALSELANGADISGSTYMNGDAAVCDILLIGRNRPDVDFTK